MPPISPDHFDFAFNPKTLESVRKQLGLTQAAVAEILDVPVNTVSRWETGATSPDAKALAAMYSIAMERGVTPQFFERRSTIHQTKRQNDQLLLAWDFQNRGLEAGEIEEGWTYMREYLKLRFPASSANMNLWAYTSTHQYGAVNQLQRLNFRVGSAIFNADAQIVEDVIRSCEERSSGMIAILVTDDGNFSELVRILRSMDVEVYVWGTDECSQNLKKALEPGAFIYWDAPFVVTECLDVIRELKGKPVNKAYLGTLCQNRLDHADIYPQDVGFSKRNPYGSLLRWLERQGIVTVAQAPRNPDSMVVGLRQ